MREYDVIRLTYTKARPNSDNSTVGAGALKKTFQGEQSEKNSYSSNGHKIHKPDWFNTKVWPNFGHLLTNQITLIHKACGRVVKACDS